MHPGRARVRRGRRAGREVGRGGQALRRQEGRGADRRRRARALPRAPDRLQVPARRRVPQRAAEVERRQDPAPRTARRGEEGGSAEAAARRAAGAAAFERPDVRRCPPTANPRCAWCRCRPTPTTTATSSAAGSCRRSTSPASIPASRRARGRVATVAVNSFVFKQPVLIGDLVSFYADDHACRADVDHRRRRGLRAAQPDRRDHRQGHRGEPHLRRRRRGPPAARAAAGVRVGSGCWCQLATTRRPRRPLGEGSGVRSPLRAGV